MTFTDLAGFLKLIGELPAIAAQADRERCGVILDDLIKDHPDLWNECVFCSKMPNPQMVLNYLSARSVYLGFMRNIPNVEPTIQFLMDFIRERESNANNPTANTGQPWTDGRYIANENSTPARCSTRRLGSKS